MSIGRGSGPPGEDLLLQHFFFFLCTVSGQISPCTISDLCGLSLSYLEAGKMPPAARMPLVLVQM